MYISVRLLYRLGLRLSANAVKCRRAHVGWLVLQPDNLKPHVLWAFLKREDGSDILPKLYGAKVVECKGPQGMLIIGTDIQPKGRKTVYEYEQAWWCEAPPRPEPFADAVERRRRAVEAHAAFEQYLADL